MNNEVSIDWLSFTVKCLEKEDLRLQNIKRIQEDLFLNFNLQPNLKSGRYSYSSAIDYNDSVTILYNEVNIRDFENNDPVLNRLLKMGIHFELSGNGCKMLLNRLTEEGITMRDYLIKLADYGVSFSRIDIAYDDFNALLDFEIIEDKMKNGFVISKMKSLKQVDGYAKIESLGSLGNRKGITLYFGNRSSNAFIRFYDKLSEQQHKGNVIPSEIESWNRYEIVLKKEKASDFVEKYRECEDLGKLYKRIIGGLIRFIDDTDSNKSRCETSEFWKKFLSDETPVMLAVKQSESDLMSVLDWFDRSVMNSLIVLLAIAEHENIDFINLLANSNRNLSAKQQNMIQEFFESDEEKKNEIIDKLISIFR